MADNNGQDPPVKTNMVDLDPSIKDVYGLPVSRVTYQHHPNDYKVAALMMPRLEAIFSEMGAEKMQSVLPLAATTAIPQIPGLENFQVGAGRSVPDPVGGSANHQMGTMRMARTPTPASSTATSASGASPTSTRSTAQSSQPRAATTRR